MSAQRQEFKESKPILQLDQECPASVKNKLKESGLQLHYNNKLLADFWIDVLKGLHLRPGKRYQRAEITEKIRKMRPELIKYLPKTGFYYSIIAVQNDFYAVFRDLSHDEEVIVARGGTAYIKNVQRLSDGAWGLLKVTPSDAKESKHHQEANHCEFEVLKGQHRAEPTPIAPTKSRKHRGKLNHQLIEERAKGQELFHVINDRKLPNDPTLLLTMCFNLAKEVASVHALGYVHSDIKIENIFAVLAFMSDKEKPGTMTLIDNGFAAPLGPTGKVIGPYHGTPEIIAPEIKQVRKDKSGRPLIDRDTRQPITVGEYSPASDIYALGIVFRAILLGHVKRPEIVGGHLVNGHLVGGHLVDHPAGHFACYDVPVKEVSIRFVDGSQMTASEYDKSIAAKKKPIERIVVDDKHNHQQYELPIQAFDLMNSMCEIDPAKRPTLAEIRTELSQCLAILSPASSPSKGGLFSQSSKDSISPVSSSSPSSKSSKSKSKK